MIEEILKLIIQIWKIFFKIRALEKISFTEKIFHLIPHFMLSNMPCSFNKLNDFHILSEVWIIVQREQLITC